MPFLRHRVKMKWDHRFKELGKKLARNVNLLGLTTAILSQNKLLQISSSGVSLVNVKENNGIHLLQNIITWWQHLFKCLVQLEQLKNVNSSVIVGCNPSRFKEVALVVHATQHTREIGLIVINNVLILFSCV